MVSDTHGRLAPLRALAPQVGEVDWLLHAGDHRSDVPGVARIFGLPPARCQAVVGNCDYPETEPLESVMELGGVRIWLTHGHKYGVKTSWQRIYYRAHELGARVAIFGHSHLPVNTEEGGLLLFNPGSPSFPRLNSSGSCGILEIQDGQPNARHLFTS